jgi:Zn-dependent protease
VVKSRVVRWQRGYLTFGYWRGAALRAHWTLPVGAFVFGQGRFVPGFWLGFFLLVLIHEIGHAVLVLRRGHRPIAIDIHGLGGECRWAGDGTPMDRAVIAWGGVNAQAVALLATVAALALLGPPQTPFVAQLVSAFTATNVLTIAFNLLPFPPLDGARAWKLPGLLRARARAHQAVRRAAREELAEMRAREQAQPSPAVRAAVDEALRRLVAGDPDTRKRH